MTAHLPPIPQLYKYTCIFTAYIAVLFLQFMLYRFENFPELTIKEKATTGSYAAYTEGFFGVSTEVSRRTFREVELMVKFSMSIIWVLIILLVTGAPLCFYMRTMFIRKRMKILMAVCRLDENILQERIKKRYAYVVAKKEDIAKREIEDVEELMKVPESFKDKLVLHDIKHVNLLIASKKVWDDAHITLQRFMFGDLNGELDWLPGLPYIIITRMLKDVLKGLQYCHSRNVYHLNVTASNIMVFKRTLEERGYIARLGGFSYATRTLSGIVLPSAIGLVGNRPPEYYYCPTLEAVKVDIWGLGICAYDCFTGGVLSMLNQEEKTLNESNIPGHVPQREKPIEAKLSLNYVNFISSMDAAWNYFGTVHQMMICSLPFTVMYDFDSYDFLQDSWKFVLELLRTDPQRRCTSGQALQSIFMVKVVDIRKVPKLNDTPIVGTFVV